jgi:hypothetical protein
VVEERGGPQEREERARELEHRRRAVAEAAEAEWREEERREQEVRAKQLREEEQWLLEQLERFLPEEGERRKERVQKIWEDAEADPELRAGLVETSKFLVGWESLQGYCEELDVPVEKVWPAHIANHPEAALNVDSKYCVELDQHLPRAVHGCLVACRICDQHKSVVDRCTECEEAQKALVTIGVLTTGPRLQNACNDTFLQPNYYTYSNSDLGCVLDVTRSKVCQLGHT